MAKYLVKSPIFHGPHGRPYAQGEPVELSDQFAEQPLAAGIVAPWPGEEKKAVRSQDPDGVHRTPVIGEGSGQVRSSDHRTPEIGEADNRTPERKIADAASYAEMQKRNLDPLDAKIEPPEAPPETAPPATIRFTVREPFKLGGRKFKKGELVEFTPKQAAEFPAGSLAMEESGRLV